MALSNTRDELLIERIIELLAKGRSLTTICKRKGMPSRRTVQRWMQGDDDLAERLLEARESGFYQIAEQTLELVEKEPDANKARVILAARQWYLGKLSNAFREKPISVGAVVNVDAGDAFAAIAGALEIAAAGIAGRGSSTRAVVIEGAARSSDSAGKLADLDGSSGPGLGENADGG